MAVYEGDEKYIFVSYAHKDTHIVLPIIEELQKNGFRVWYDGGIEAGTEWPEYIADHLERCAVALLFISDNALASKNCRREINFAISEECEMLAIYLSDVKLSSGMKMQLGTIQAMFRNRFIDDASFAAAICDARIIRECRDGFLDGDDEEMQSVADENDKLDVFFGAERQKKKSMQKTLDDYTMTLPIKAYNGVVGDDLRCAVLDNARILDEVLASAKIKAIVSSIVIGPRVTTYYINAERGMRFTQLESLVDEIKFSLSVDEVRIIPPSGASRPGFEILNSNQQIVTLEELLKEARLREQMSIEARSDTWVPLGRSTVGDAVFADVAKFPHLLMAGITQTGKSTLLHAMIASMITRVPKERLRLILVDLKGVEFNIYDKEPHMLLPVIHNSADAVRALNWLCDEMENRYKQLQAANVRGIDAYNELPENQDKLMPRLLLFIDDYTDLVYNYQKQIEGSVARLSQKSRAAGIHVILSTQRAEASTITGLIAANIPTKILFRTYSAQDSRFVIHSGDAASLNARGDAIYAPIGDPTPTRIHTPYVSIETLESIVSRLKKRVGEAEYMESAMEAIIEPAVIDDDDSIEYYNNQKFLDAVVIAIGYGKLSASLLQRKLSIGYGRAMKYIDKMEELGIIGAANGQKPREVLMSIDEWHEHLLLVRTNSKNNTEPLFNDVVEYAIAANAISTSAIQRKFSIGFARAMKIIDRMFDLGIVSEANGSKPRKILISMEEWENIKKRNGDPK